MLYYSTIHGQQELAEGVVLAGLDFTYFQNVSCAGLVPGTDVLMEELGIYYVYYNYSSI